MSISSEHFSAKEMACPHCGIDGCHLEIFNALEQFRSMIGGLSVYISSAYRCSVHNTQVGGVPNSEHVQGIAADIRVEGMTGSEMEAAAMKCPLITAIGRSDNPPYIHIDVRKMSQGHALWCYDAEGKWCRYFPPPAIAV